jgi:hypothetical protein
VTFLQPLPSAVGWVLNRECTPRLTCSPANACTAAFTALCVQQVPAAAEDDLQAAPGGGPHSAPAAGVAPELPKPPQGAPRPLSVTVQAVAVGLVRPGGGGRPGSAPSAPRPLADTCSDAGAAGGAARPAGSMLPPGPGLPAAAARMGAARGTNASPSVSADASPAASSGQAGKLGGRGRVTPVSVSPSPSPSLSAGPGPGAAPAAGAGEVGGGRFMADLAVAMAARRGERAARAAPSPLALALEGRQRRRGQARLACCCRLWYSLPGPHTALCVALRGGRSARAAQARPGMSGGPQARLA